MDILPAYLKRPRCANLNCGGMILLSSALSGLISVQVKGGPDEISEKRMPNKAIRIQELGRVCLARRLSWLRCLSPLSADRGPGANQIGFTEREIERGIETEWVGEWGGGHIGTEEGWNANALQRGGWGGRALDKCQCGFFMIRILCLTVCQWLDFSQQVWTAGLNYTMVVLCYCFEAISFKSLLKSKNAFSITRCFSFLDALFFFF